MSTRVPAAALLLVLASSLLLSAPAAAAREAPGPDAAAARAFAELLHAYRGRPGLRVRSTLTIELKRGEIVAQSSELKAEFLYRKDGAGVVRIKDFESRFRPPDFWTIHAGTEHSYYHERYEGSPYWPLFSSFQDLPYPHLGILWGEPKPEEVWMQLELATPMLVPTALEEFEIAGAPRHRLVLSGPGGTLRLVVDPKRWLIESAEHEITGGGLVEPGTRRITRYRYEYEVFDRPPDDALFVLDPGGRQRVDLVAALAPPRTVTAPEPGLALENMPAPLVGQPAPPFVLATMDEDAIDLEELRGRIVVLDFWSTWCGPCRRALPLLHDVAAWARQRRLDVEVITVNVWEVRDPRQDTPDARRDAVRAYWKDQGFSLPVAMDYSDETAAAYGVTGIPTTIVIRADGVVHAQHSGMGTSYEATLKADITDALDLRDAAADGP